jgi:hypothetical protein
MRSLSTGGRRSHDGLGVAAVVEVSQRAVAEGVVELPSSRQFGVAWYLKLLRNSQAVLSVCVVSSCSTSSRRYSTPLATGSVSSRSPRGSPRPADRSRRWSGSRPACRTRRSLPGSSAPAPPGGRRGVGEAGQGSRRPGSAPPRRRWRRPDSRRLARTPGCPADLQAVVRALVLQRVVQVEAGPVRYQEAGARAAPGSQVPSETSPSSGSAWWGCTSRRSRRGRCRDGRPWWTASPGRSRRRASWCRDRTSTCATASVRSPCSWVSGTTGELSFAQVVAHAARSGSTSVVSW